MFSIASRALSYLTDTYRIKTNPVKYARSKGVQVGAGCKFGDIDRGTFGTEPYLISIGDHVELTSGVRFITHDGSVWLFRDAFPDIDIISPITVGSNVFIGMRSLILCGVNIGSNVIIGAGSVVTKDVPSGVVCAGVPARTLCEISDYESRVKSKMLHTRRMGLNEKQAFLKNKFSNLT